MIRAHYLLLLCVLVPFSLLMAQINYLNHWEIKDKTHIIWNLDNDQNLPHSDNIEMAGTKVAGIITYAIDSLGMLSLKRQVFFPQLHPLIKETDPDWFIYRAYLQDTYTDAILPKLFIGDKQFSPGKVQEARINGMLEFEHAPSSTGIALTRTLYPSMDERLFIENWLLTNATTSPIKIRVANAEKTDGSEGKDEKYYRQISSCFDEFIELAPGASYRGIIQMMARKEGEVFPACDALTALLSRKEFLSSMETSLNLETPEPILNTLFEFSKVRAAESIFESQLGLVHSPGGGRYYVGIWANDQAEYVSPLFPFLGYKRGNVSALNTYRAFAKEINSEYTPLRYAFEIEGLVPPFLLDRGDAAMIAYGASQYALASGDMAVARELWPLIEWCLQYNHRKLNSEGVIDSESDEMEGRIETGTANLSTASLYYGALQHAMDLGKSIAVSDRLLRNYKRRSKRLKVAIENYFGATIDGLNTYKYYKEHEQLRHWICLPLVVGIHDRKEDTIEALFDRLWSENGVHVEKNSDNPAISKIFWDRGTLYALRGTFLAGATEISLNKLMDFSKERLLGKRVPYVVEAFPEGNMAHLSAESGLYCRVFTEGMFGITPTGLKTFSIQPHLPEQWDSMSLRNIKAFGENFDITVFKKEGSTYVKVTDLENNSVIIEAAVDEQKPLNVQF